MCPPGGGSPANQRFACRHMSSGSQLPSICDSGALVVGVGELVLDEERHAGETDLDAEQRLRGGAGIVVFVSARVAAVGQLDLGVRQRRADAGARVRADARADAGQAQRGR